MASSSEAGRAWSVLVCAVVVNPGPAQASINVWTSHGPPGGDVPALDVYPSYRACSTPRRSPASKAAPERPLVKEAAMTRSNDSRRPRRTCRQFTAAALVLLASVGWARQVSAVDPPSGGSAAPSKIGAGQVRTLAIDPDTPTTLYAGTLCSGVLKSLDGGDSWSAGNAGLTRSSYVYALAIDPTTPTTLYAATLRGGVFKSLNGVAGTQPAWQIRTSPRWQSTRRRRPPCTRGGVSTACSRVWTGVPSGPRSTPA